MGGRGKGGHCYNLWVFILQTPSLELPYAVIINLYWRWTLCLMLFLGLSLCCFSWSLHEISIILVLIVGNGGTESSSNQSLSHRFVSSRTSWASQAVGAKAHTLNHQAISSHNERRKNAGDREGGRDKSRSSGLHQTTEKHSFIHTLKVCSSNSKCLDSQIPLQPGVPIGSISPL